MAEYHFSSELVNIYKELNNGKTDLADACALGSAWAVLTREQTEWLINFAKKQLDEKDN